MTTFPPGSVVPAQHLRFTDFLPADLHTQVLAFATSAARPFVAGRVEGNDAQHEVDPSIRSARVLHTLDEAWPPFDDRIRTLLPLVLPASPAGVEADDLPIEKTLLRYDDGDFYRTHADNGGGIGAGRLVTFVYYFNVAPKRFTGGELWLHDTRIDDDGYAVAADSFTSIEPEDNSIVFFPSHVFHQVRPVRATTDDPLGSRFAVNGWIHERPRAGRD